MARRLFTIVFLLCCFWANSLASRDKGVPLEYVSAVFVLEKIDTLHLEIRISSQGKLESIQLTKNGNLFGVNDSTIQFFRQFMIHGFEIGSKTEKKCEGLYIHLLAPTNYEGFAIVIDDKGITSIEKIFSPFTRKKGESVKIEDYKPKRIYPNNNKLHLNSLHIIYNLGLSLGKMEIETKSANNLLIVNAFEREEKIILKGDSSSINSISLYEAKHNELYLLKLPDEDIRLTTSK